MMIRQNKPGLGIRSGLWAILALLTGCALPGIAIKPVDDQHRGLSVPMLHTEDPARPGANQAGEEKQAQSPAEAVWQPLSAKPFFRIETSLDTRGVWRVEPMFGIPLPGKFHAFGFINLDSARRAEDEFDTTQFFTELRLTSPLWHGFGLQAEYDDATATRIIGRA